jgi:hypothetical protein
MKADRSNRGTPRVRLVPNDLLFHAEREEGQNEEKLGPLGTFMPPHDSRGNLVVHPYEVAALT